MAPPRFPREPEEGRGSVQLPAQSSIRRRRKYSMATSRPFLLTASHRKRWAAATSRAEHGAGAPLQAPSPDLNLRRSSHVR